MFHFFSRINQCILILIFSMSTAFAGTKVTIETNMGSIGIELEDDKAPITVKNFLAYVDSSFYSETIFHRVINGFMIQGGGFDSSLVKKNTKAPIVLESPATTGLSNSRGTVAMARTSAPNSATSQFFINVKDNANLDGYGGGYAVFGKVISGMAVVEKIKAVNTTSKKYMRDVPVQPVVILNIKRTK